MVETVLIRGDDGGVSAARVAEAMAVAAAAGTDPMNAVVLFVDMVISADGETRTVQWVLHDVARALAQIVARLAGALVAVAADGYAPSREDVIRAAVGEMLAVEG